METPERGEGREIISRPSPLSRFLLKIQSSLTLTFYIKNHLLEIRGGFCERLSLAYPRAGAAIAAPEHFSDI